MACCRCFSGDGGDTGPRADIASPERRAALKALLGAGVSVALAGSARAQGSDPAQARPRAGDVFVPAGGNGSSPIVRAADVRLAAPPVVAYPMDPATKVVRDQSRLNQILLIRLDPADLSAETRGRAADGIVAYSAVCTHTGCDTWEWLAPMRAIKCPCHFSIFDVKDGARVVDGPAPRRLPSLPLEIASGTLRAAGGFLSRPGFQTG